MILFLLLGLSISASAAEPTAEEIVAGELHRIAEEAALHQPPCAAMDRLSEHALKLEPASDCPRAREFYSFILTIDRYLRDGCQAHVSHAEKTLRDPLYCANREKAGWLDGQHKALHKIMVDAVEPWFDHQPKFIDALSAELASVASGTAKGELARKECSQPVLMGMQYRQKQLWLFNRIRGHSTGAISESCSGNEAPGSAYLRYLRGGESALEAK